VDVCLYTLMKWAGLAVKGNPSALHFLFVPLEFTTDTWNQFSTRPEIFLAKGHVQPFLGFADDQMKRLLGQKGQKNIHRADLEERHGYDTKYAMHVIRLYGEAKELMEHGRITLPRPNREELVEIRQGKYSLTEIRELGAQLESEALAAQATSPLPDEVDREAISQLLADTHLQFWNASKR
jgi:predicted nucleotidyltransferase